jgi:hypothetical protein
MEEYEDHGTRKKNAFGTYGYINGLIKFKRGNLDLGTSLNV